MLMTCLISYILTAIRPDMFLEFRLFWINQLLFQLENNHILSNKDPYPASNFSITKCDNNQSNFVNSLKLA